MKIYKYGTVADLRAQLDSSKEVYLDTETSKLGSQIRLIQVYQEHWPEVLIFDTTNTSILAIWTYLQNSFLIGHNLGYDLGCFKKDLPDGMYEPPKKWHDTFYLSRLVYPEWQKFSLDVCLTHILGYDPYEKEGLNKKELQLSFERLKVKDVYIEGPEGLRDLTEKQEIYAAIDVYELPSLYHAVKHFEDDINHTLDRLTIEHGMELSDGGMPVDADRLAEMERGYYTTIADIDKQLPVGFNVNSYMQVRKLIGTQLSSDETLLSIIKARDSGLTGLWFRLKPPIAKAAFKALGEGLISVEKREFGVPTTLHTIEQLEAVNKPRSLVYYSETKYVHTEDTMKYADLIIRKRKALKRLNFVSRARANVKADGRLHPTLSPHAISGRVQQSDENLTQYPRDMKTMFGLGNNPDRKLIYADYSQLELRTICAILPERNMEKAYRAGIDLHTFTADKLTLDESALPPGMGKRNVAKMCNFLNLYGGGVANFQNVVTKFAGVWLEEDLVKKVTKEWGEGFSDIKSWHAKNQANKSKMDRTVLGRRYKADIVTDLNNIRVSGSGAEAAKLAMHYIYKYLIPKYGGDVIALNFVHDSFILECPSDPAIYKLVAHDLGLCMFMGWREAMANAAIPDLPMPVNVRVGSNWGDIEKDIFDYEVDIDCNYEEDYFADDLWSRARAS